MFIRKKLLSFNINEIFSRKNYRLIVTIEIVITKPLKSNLNFTVTRLISHMHKKLFGDCIKIQGESII